MTSNDIQKRKAELRDKTRALVRSMGAEAREDRASQLRARLEGLEVWRNAQSVLFFAPLPDEMDVWPLVSKALSAGKRILLPKFSVEQAGLKNAADEKAPISAVGSRGRYGICDLSDVEKGIALGRYGIREPIGQEIDFGFLRLDFIIVPGIAFDLHGRRVGRGKGFYDQLLAEVRGKTCGIAFDEQIIDEVPAEPHDVRLNCILTPTRWIEL